MNERLQHKLSELRRALFEALSDSSDVHRAWRDLRDEGYALYLLVDCKPEAVADDDAPRAAAAPLPEGEPVFQIDGKDLTFLKSIGIDPTRRARRRS